MLKTESIIESLEQIGSGAYLSTSYVVMNILAALFLAYGYFHNQSSVILGAMVVSMLLGPVIAAALALVQKSFYHFFKALVTELLGVGIIFSVGFFISFFWKGAPIPQEVMARTIPLAAASDFVIATMSGIVATTALLFPSQRLAFIGATLALSLSPHITAAGIFLFYGKTALSLKALLIAFYNFLGALCGAFMTLVTIKHLEKRWGNRRLNLDLND